MNIWRSLSLPKSEKSYHELVSFSLSESLAYNCMIISTTAAFTRFVLSISLTAVFSVCSLFFHCKFISWDKWSQPYYRGMKKVHIENVQKIPFKEHMYAVYIKSA